MSPSKPYPLPSVYNFYGFFRQDSILKRNYLRLPSWSNDSLLMDYNLQIGDTVKSGLYYHQSMSGCSGPFKIISTDSIQIGMQKFKRFYTDNFGQKYCNVKSPGYFFIEGLGHINGIFEKNIVQEMYCLPFEGCPGVDTILFNTPCHNIAGIKSKNENSFAITISPNPFSSSTTLQLNRTFNDATLTIYNLCGEQVRQINLPVRQAGNISGNTIIIQRDNLPGGLYFWQLKQGSEILSGKMVVAEE